MLTLSTLRNDLYRLIGSSSTAANATITEAVRLAILKGQQFFSLYADWGFLEQYRTTCYIPLGLPYETGTALPAQDSKAVVGTTTAWTAAHIGQYFRLTSKEFYEIADVTAVGAMTLAIPFQDSTPSATGTYSIFKKFYDLPLDFARPEGQHARLTQPGYTSEWLLGYDRGAAIRDYLREGRPLNYAVLGNPRGQNYYDTSTVTIATSSSISTWTLAAGTLPTDIVDRWVRVSGEDRGYRIKTRATAATFTTYETYVNPSDATNTQATASSYAISPKESYQVCFDYMPTENRYIFTLPYIKKMQEMLSATDVSPISLAGYDEAFLAVCRAQLAMDGRTAMRADLVKALIQSRDEALALAWGAEQYGVTKQLQAEGPSRPRRQAGPSWIGM